MFELDKAIEDQGSMLICEFVEQVNPELYFLKEEVVFHCYSLSVSDLLVQRLLFFVL